MKTLKTPLVFVLLVQSLVFATSCKNENVENGNGEKQVKEKSTEERIFYERTLKDMVKNIPFIVHLKTVSRLRLTSSTTTAFFVDQRGYLVSTRHGYSSDPKNDAAVVTFDNGESVPVRFVDEVQTLDLVVVATDKPVAFPVAKFANLQLIFARGKRYSGDELEFKNSMVVVRCINENGTAPLNRIQVGEFLEWRKDWPVVEFLQLQQNSWGCSGAPIFNTGGEVIGMFRSVAGGAMFGTDASSVSEAVKLIIEEDVKKKNQGGQQ